MNRYFILLLLCTSWLGNFSSIAQAKDRGDILFKQGYKAYSSGNYGLALRYWKRAENHFRISKSFKEASRITINQSSALQKLGHYPQSCLKVLEVLDIDKSICRYSTEAESILPFKESTLNIDPNLSIISLQILGESLRNLQHYKLSEQALNIALSLAIKQSKQREIAAIKLSKANLFSDQFRLYKQDFINQNIDLYTSKSLPVATLGYESAQKAFALYQELFATQLEAKSKLSWLALYKELESWVASKNGDQAIALLRLDENLENEHVRLLENLSINDADILPIELAYAHLQMADHYLSMKNRSNDSITSISFHIIEALKIANQLNNARVLSSTYALQGKISYENQQIEKAITFYRKAAEYSQSSGALDLDYQWSYELAKLYAQQGQISDALIEYESNGTEISCIIQLA